MIPLNVIPWRLIGILVGVGLLAAALWWVTNRIRVSYEAEAQRDAARAELVTERAQNAANIGKIATDLSEREAAAGLLLGRMDALDARFNGLLLNLPPPDKLVSSQEVPGAPCPRVSIGPEFFRVFNEAGAPAGAGPAEAQTH